MMLMANPSPRAMPEWTAGVECGADDGRRRHAVGYVFSGACSREGIRAPQLLKLFKNILACAFGREPRLAFRLYSRGMACAFCGGNPTTNEHIFPRWLERY